MPDPRAPGFEADSGEVERLSQGWNALVAGDASVLEALDPGDAAVVRQLGELAGTPVPRRAFSKQLKEQLMDASIAAPMSGVVEQSRPLTIVPGRPVVGAGRGRRWWTGAWSGAGPEPGGGRPQTQAAAVAGTPDATPDSCSDCDDDYLLGPTGAQYLGQGLLQMGGQPTAKDVQLQHWILDPGARIEMENAADGVHGQITDIVLQGTAAMTIDAPAMVMRGRLTRKANIEYPSAGSLVELGRGDSISYPAGSAKTIVNPLTTVPLQFKSIVVYAGDVSLTQPKDQAADGKQIRVDGDGVIPDELLTLGTGLTVILDYLLLYSGGELSPVGSNSLYPYYPVIGPVDSLQSNDDEGYVVWIGKTRG